MCRRRKFEQFGNRGETTALDVCDAAQFGRNGGVCRRRHTVRISRSRVRNDDRARVYVGRGPDEQAVSLGERRQAARPEEECSGSDHSARFPRSNGVWTDTSPCLESAGLADRPVVEQLRQGRMEQPLKPVASGRPAQLVGGTARARVSHHDVVARRQIDDTSIGGFHETIGDKPHRIHSVRNASHARARSSPDAVSCLIARVSQQRSPESNCGAKGARKYFG